MRVSFLLVLCLGFISGCANQLPNLTESEKPHSQTLPSLGLHSPLSQTIAPLLEKYPEQSGVYPLTDGVDAFVARLALIRAATRSIDVQYYIYHGDETGQLLTATLMQAAERGVRVRMLLDDMNTSGKDNALMLLADHPNVEVRLFNPFLNRLLRGWEFLGNFARANRRMHNKSLTVDGLATIVGGRNIGDEYFSANQSVDFGDFDLWAIGPVVDEIAGQFDLYWNSHASYPVAALVAPTGLSWSEAKPRIQQALKRYQHSEYVERLRNATLIDDLARPDFSLYWGKAYALFDHPSKANPKHQENQLTSTGLPDSYMLPQLIEVLDQTENNLVLVSPYFVPGNEGVQLLTQYRQRGIKVRVVTNSLAATDVVAVHSGYRRYRKDLLKAGVELREVRVDANMKPGSWRGSSKVSLHAKTFYADDKTLFVGSFNLDPRSAALNTELGIVIESEPLVRWLKTSFETQLKQTTYKVELKREKLVWTGIEGTHKKEPNASLWRRLGAALLGLLPIEQHL
ncbi:MAG: phospholipase D family protein [Cellvibrionaceae bacterium]